MANNHELKQIRYICPFDYDVVMALFGAHIGKIGVFNLLISMICITIIIIIMQY